MVYIKSISSILSLHQVREAIFLIRLIQARIYFTGSVVRTWSHRYERDYQQKSSLSGKTCFTLSMQQK